jgi:hypothetical protein
LRNKLVIVMSVLMSVVMLTMIGANGVLASSEPIYGDANGDHRVSIGDVTKIERMILGLDPVTPGADANIDGVINMADVITVEKQILGLLPIYGDADGTGNVDQADVVKVQRMVLNLEQPTRGADANRDGRISIADVTAIERMID